MRIVERYKEVTRKALQCREEGKEVEEDHLLDFLDVLWDQMCENSRRQIGEWVKVGMPGGGYENHERRDRS